MNVILLEFMNKINLELLGRDSTEPLPISGQTMDCFVIVNLSLSKVIYLKKNVYYLVDIITKECITAEMVDDDIHVISIDLNPFEELPVIQKFIPFPEIEYNSFSETIKEWFKDALTTQEILDSIPGNKFNFIERFGSYIAYH